jgi:hypothetical protein
MTACNGCGRDNPSPRRYCGGCGDKLFWDCATCGFANRADDRFCGGCGCAAAAERDAARPPALAAVPRQRTEPATKGRTAAAGVTMTELASLLAPPELPAAAAQPSGRITQDDLDNLFKAGS